MVACGTAMQIITMQQDLKTEDFIPEALVNEWRK